MTSIDTAVPLFEKKDLEQPLLIDTTTTEEENSSWYNIHLGDDGDGDEEDEDEDEQKKRTSSTDASCCWQFLNGFLVGFILHTVCLGIAAIIAIHSGAALKSPNSWIFWTRDLQLTPMVYMWLLFIYVTCIAIEIASNVDYDGEFRFHVGLVFGCFIGVMDLYFGAPLGVFATLFATLLACHSLYNGMTVLHDRFIINH